jgi:DNA-binding transcriptional ArsR family regulator
MEVAMPISRQERDNQMNPQANDNETSGASDQQLARALTHPLRARLFEEVGQRPLSPSELAAILKVPLSKIAYHSRVLEEAGGVERDDEDGALMIV